MILSAIVSAHERLGRHRAKGYPYGGMRRPAAQGTTPLAEEVVRKSRALPGEVEGATAPVWDAYLLYDPETTWGGGDPSRPISSGYTVIGAQEELDKTILPLLK
jgi:hypothetical protein